MTSLPSGTVARRNSTDGRVSRRSARSLTSSCRRSFPRRSKRSMRSCSGRAAGKESSYTGSATGTQVTVASRWALQRDEQGNRIAILETNNDITERKRAEYLTRHVFESSPDSIAIVGNDYRYQRVNPVYAQFWGMPAEKIVGMHIADVVGREVFEQRAKSNLDRCFAGEEVSFAEWFATPHGRKYRAISCSPLRPNLQRVQAALATRRSLEPHVIPSA